VTDDFGISDSEHCLLSTSLSAPVGGTNGDIIQHLHGSYMHTLLRIDYTFSLQGALNEDSKGLSSAKE
jgi:hypothetical protein